MQTAVEAKAVKNMALARSSVSIRPYVSGASNLGLEKYNQALFDGAKQRDVIYVEGNGRIKTYWTGLNELDASVQTIKDEAEKRAKIMDIRQVVARCENELAGNFTVSPDTCMDKYGKPGDDFWANVHTFKSVIPDTFDNDGKRIPTYWDTMVLELDNAGQNLDSKKLTDVLIMYAIEAHGFSMVATSYEEAKEGGDRFKFYLDKVEITAAVKGAGGKLRNKAGSDLQKMYDKDTNKLYYVTKLISMESLYFKSGQNSTPVDILYEECNRFIDGLGRQKGKQAACEEFLDLCKQDMETLKLRCIVQDAALLQIISHKPSGLLFHVKTDAAMGKTVPDVMAYLNNPLHQDVYDMIFSEIEKHWKG